MKVVYISDLDGTLLNKNQELEEEAIEEINKLIDKGIDFTVCTGRGKSAIPILKDVNFKLPIVLVNGTISYDTKNNKFISENIIAKESAIKVKQVLDKFNYIRSEVLIFVNNDIMEYKLSEWDTKEPCLAFRVLHKTENSLELSKILREIDGINYFIHRKVYSPSETHCDIVPKDISKGNSISSFKKEYNFDKIIAFGDSANDLSMAEAADEFYAVENATKEVKEKATKVIESCYEQGVIKFIKEKNKN